MEIKKTINEKNKTADILGPVGKPLPATAIRYRASCKNIYREGYFKGLKGYNIVYSYPLILLVGLQGGHVPDKPEQFDG